MTLLTSIRLVDSHDGRISLSVVALVSSLGFLLAVQSAVALGAFSVACALYAHRRMLVHRSSVREERITRLQLEQEDLLQRTKKLETRLAVENNRGVGR